MAGLKRPRAVWPIVWGALCVAAVCIGVMTRLSYTSDSRDANALGELVYACAPYAANELERIDRGIDTFSAKDLMGEADAVVVGSPCGAGEYIHHSFLTAFSVTDVVRGDSSLASTEIKVFEPVGMYDWPDGRVLAPSGAYQAGGTFMRSDARYVLFLKRAPSSIGVDGWVMLDSPYARMPVARDFTYRIDQATAYATPLKEFEGIDLVVADEASLEAYRQAQDDVLACAGLR